jgi:SNF2 family DNA or RNA helicase
LLQLGVGRVKSLLELQLRGLAERILVVCPANLSFQWQRELKEKFDDGV